MIYKTFVRVRSTLTSCARWVNLERYKVECLTHKDIATTPGMDRQRHVSPSLRSLAARTAKEEITLTIVQRYKSITLNSRIEYVGE